MSEFFDIHTHKVPESGIFNWDLKEAFPDVPVSIGVHPWKLLENLDESWEKVETFSKKSNVKLVGETGLDFVCSVDRTLQLQVFKKHIKLAKDLKKPLILHCVRAYDDCLRELKDFTAPIIFHDYNGGEVVTKKILQHENTFMSLGATLFRENSKVVPLLSEIPLERIFLETDDSKKSIEEVFKKFSDLVGVELSQVQSQILSNASRILSSGDQK